MLASAGSAAPSEYSFFLGGDLCQMGNQKNFLQAKDFDVQQRDVYPVLKEADKEKALRAIWESRCDGWWHYEEQYIKLGICTAEEFKETLDIQCAQSREERERTS